MTMILRSYRPSDAQALSELYARSVRGLGPRDYRPEQVDAWASLAPTAEVMDRRCRDGRRTVIAVDAQDRPLAFTDLEADGHIGFFYCSPEAAGTGVAAALCEALEVAAREAGLRRLYVEASEAARRMFLRHGFRELARRDLTIGDVPIHNFAMEKQLPP